MSNGDDDGVGYGQPPKSHQFPPGKSGNPRGRPRRRKSLLSAFLDAMSETITIVENNKRKSITLNDAIAKQCARQAARGDAKALKLLLGMLPLLEQEAARRRANDPPSVLVVSPEMEERLINAFREGL